MLWPAVELQARSVSEHESLALGQGAEPLFRVAVKSVGAGGTPAAAGVWLAAGCVAEDAGVPVARDGEAAPPPNGWPTTTKAAAATARQTARPSSIG